jgi:hypothetical protein
MTNQAKGSCYRGQQAQAERMGRPKVDALGNSISNHPPFLTIENGKTLQKNARFAEQPGWGWVWELRPRSDRALVQGLSLFEGRIAPRAALPQGALLHGSSRDFA